MIAAAGSESKIEVAKKYGGADHGVNYTKTGWQKEVLALTKGKGVDIIIDYVGPSTFAANLNAVARDGRVVCLGLLGGPKLTTEMDMPVFAQLLGKRVRYEGTTLRSRDEGYQQRLRDQFVLKALPRFQDGSFRIIIEEVYQWDQIQEVHRRIEANKTMGKLVCVIR